MTGGKSWDLNLVSEGVKTITTTSVIDSVVTTSTDAATIVTKNYTEVSSTGATTAVTTVVENSTVIGAIATIPV